MVEVTVARQPEVDNQDSQDNQDGSLGVRLRGVKSVTVEPLGFVVDEAQGNEPLKIPTVITGKLKGLLPSRHALYQAGAGMPGISPPKHVRRFLRRNLNGNAKKQAQWLASAFERNKGANSAANGLASAFGRTHK